MIGLYVLTILIWGTTWLPIKFSLGVVAPEVSVIYRLAIATTILFTWCLIKGYHLRYTRKQHVKMILFGVFLYAVDLTLLYEGSEYLTSGIVAITFSTIVIFNIINKRIFLSDSISGSSLVGAILGLIGLCIAFWPDVLAFSRGVAGKGELSGLLLVLGAALAGSIGNITSTVLQKDGVPVTQSNAYGMLYGVIALLIYSSFRGSVFNFDSSIVYVSSLLYLALFGSVLAFGFYLTLIGTIGADKAAYANLIFPIIAVAISTIFEGFAIDRRLLFAIAIILIGNYLMHIKPVWFSIKHSRETM